jgi:hypothetical protein
MSETCSSTSVFRGIPKTSAKIKIKIYPTPRISPEHPVQRENRTYHTNEQPRLLCGTTNTGITDDSDGESCGETCETDGETGTELDEAGVEGHG